jgi:hypothetical protein
MIFSRNRTPRAQSKDHTLKPLAKVETGRILKANTTPRNRKTILMRIYEGVCSLTQAQQMSPGRQVIK